jgi:parallel beta-helix repeat protein
MDGVIIEDNGFSDCDIAARTISATSVVIRNNSASAMESQTFVLYWGANAIIANNSLDCLGDAISLYGTDDVLVTGNEINPAGAGVVAHWARNLSITSNVIQGGVYGIHLQGINAGVWIEASEEVNVTYNNIVNNYVGVALISSEDGNTTAMVHHNNINSIGIQAIDNAGSSGLWDDGIGEGNYWNGSYAGSDGDSNGIGDTPFEIDQNSSDRYPLMSVLYFE